MVHSVERLNVQPLNLGHALRLRCPHCGQTPLRKDGAWFQFRDGCRNCHYQFEREQGYFTGAYWVMTYTVGALVGVAVAVLLLWQAPQLDVTLIAVIAGVAAGLAAFFFMPYGKALWIVLDHYLHPLERGDAWQ